jgi:DNA mismatch repair ATPase MutL
MGALAEAVGGDVDGGSREPVPGWGGAGHPAVMQRSLGGANRRRQPTMPHLPALLAERDYAAALMDVLEILRSPPADDILDEGLPRVVHRLLTVMACHGAVRAHQHLHGHEIRALLHDLAGAAMPLTCPHGRPVLRHIALADIEKKFLRC